MGASIGRDYDTFPMSLSREQFARDRKRRFGASNPEEMTCMAWEHAVRTRESSYSHRETFGVAHDYKEPDWCFQRFGMSKAFMPDGRIICIGGEHEDWYDPDFCIYNDVVVLRPDDGKETVDMESGRVEIYGYPEALFPPTDFHSATLVGDEIYIIGSLGYMDAREAGRTPIAVLDTRDYSIRSVESHGKNPGWIYRHSGAYEPATHSIIVRAGEVLVPQRESERVSNRSVYRLHLNGMKWEGVAEHERRYHFRIERGNYDSGNDAEPEYTDFCPRTIPHVYLGREGMYAYEYAILVDGVRFRFADMCDIEVLCEGECRGDLMMNVLNEIAENLRDRTWHQWKVKPVDENDPGGFRFS